MSHMFFHCLPFGVVDGKFTAKVWHRFGKMGTEKIKWKENPEQREKNAPDVFKWMKNDVEKCTKQWPDVR